MKYPKDAEAPAAGWRSLVLTATGGVPHRQPRVVAIVLVCLAIGTAYQVATYGWHPDRGSAADPAAGGVRSRTR